MDGDVKTTFSLEPYARVISGLDDNTRHTHIRIGHGVQDYSCTSVDLMCASFHNTSLNKEDVKDLIDTCLECELLNICS